MADFPKFFFAFNFPCVTTWQIIERKLDNQVLYLIFFREIDFSHEKNIENFEERNAHKMYSIILKILRH